MCNGRAGRRLRRQRGLKALPNPPPVIYRCQHCRSSIQWLYLCHRFLQVYLCQRLHTETHAMVQPSFSIDSIEQSTNTLSIILDNEILEFNSTAAACPNAAAIFRSIYNDDDDVSNYSYMSPPSPQLLPTSTQCVKSSDNSGLSAHYHMSPPINTQLSTPPVHKTTKTAAPTVIIQMMLPPHSTSMTHPHSHQECLL